VIWHDDQLISYQDLGPAEAPVVLLIHGLASDSTTWTRAADRLAELGYRVIAPDLLGHGSSDKPADRYQLTDFAESLDTLLTELEVRPVAVVGHSFGGAVAMQLAHRHSELVQRLVLVSAGGLGRQVHPLLRAAALPGAHSLVRVMLNERTAALYRRPGLHRSLRLSPDVIANLGRAGRGLSSPTGRSAFFQTLKMAIDPLGQRGSLLELDDVLLDLPTLIVWSERDPVVPVAHAHDTHAHLPNSRLEVFEGSTHQPHHHSARRFAQAVADFVTST
jgi:pimeloyl-ACP methyl ester carboxylesterase